MKNITISEFEYNQLLFTIEQLREQLTKFKSQKNNNKKTHKSVVQRLHGVLTMPEGFDEKQILQDGILKKYLSNVSF